MESEFDCRLCGKSEKKITHRHLPCEKSKHARDIKLALNIEIENDPPFLSNFICESCRLKLVRWRKDVNKKKKAKIYIEVVEIESGDILSQSQSNSTCWQGIESLANELGWVSNIQDGSRCFIKLQEDRVLLSICVDSDLNCRIIVLGKVVKFENILENSTSINDASIVEKLMNKISCMKVCPGNDDFSDICRYRYPSTLAKFRNTEDILIASEEHLAHRTTIRTVACGMLCDSQQERCSNCQVFRPNLFMQRSRMKNNSSETKLTHRLDYMTTGQLKERVLNSRDEIRSLKRKMDSLKEQLSKYCDKLGVKLDIEISESFVSIMKENNDIALSKFKENSPQYILWKQQLEAATKSNLKQMRWHPTLLRWCIALHAKSPSAYRMLKKSNVLTLPHENTLRDYTKFTSTQSGWNTDVIDRAILDFSILDDPLKQNISLLFDEVKVKSGLVYCSESGRLIGFCDLGSVNNDIQNFCINESETSEPGIASHIMTIMIRGIFSNLECVVAHYPCKGFTSYQLFWIIWHGIGILEKYGLIVRALVCDGATPNRKFYRIHGQNQDLCYFTNNEYGDEINLYFICDAPYLMKTTRNNFENSGWNNKTRNLMLNGKPIKWSQIVTLVEGDIHGMGLRLLPRISYEHLHLTPTLRMRVKLAVQILSSSVANALQLKGNPETESTQLFIRMFDKFFDCLNVSNTKSGIFQRKPTCAPYTNINDWRFKWLEEDFLKFLTKWEQEGENQADLSKKEKKKLCLSRETLEGLRITVKSFVELGKQLLLLPNVRFLLSEKFNQDPLEEYFSKQRGMGGFCDNPTVRQFQNNALQLQVANAPAVMASTRGNCQTRQNAQPIEAPLSKRKHKRH